MGIFAKVNGEQKEAWSQHVKVNGEWHRCKQFTKVNGLWKEVYTPEISPDRIVGFKFVYERCKSDYTDEKYPNLKVNYNLPVSINLTGYTKGTMDTNEKGIALEYRRYLPELEGIIFWEANLYAILDNGVYLNIDKTLDTEEDIRLTKEANDCEYESWCTNKIKDFSIKIQAKLSHESVGYYTSGWNRLFQNIDCIDPTIYATHELKTINHNLDAYNLLPLKNRNDMWNETAKIGIARDMTSKWYNMVGSEGLLDQTIQKVWLNDAEKPFVIEIFN